MTTCPIDNAKMHIKSIKKETSVKSESITYQYNTYVCDECGIEVGTIEQTAKIQKIIADAYRRKVGLLTGEEIKSQRKKLGLSQKGLADKAGIGIASIKRWENGIIQTKAMNSALKAALIGKRTGNVYTGNRTFSLSRIKLVANEFENETGMVFLEDGDMMLFDAKYFFYADMVAYHRLGKGLSGATYAALPHGPQLDNYKELVSIIRESDETKAEPLTEEEKRIITRVAVTFPKKQMIMDAVHREKVWKNKRIGAQIPYSHAWHLTEIQL